MTNSQVQAWLDQEDQHVVQTIRKHGQFIQLVGGDPSDVSALVRLTYDVKRGRFPWDPGYANDPGLQPRPGTWRA
jgi:hypothetical protein